MTYPVGGAPDGAFQLGTVRGAQELDEPSVKSIIRGRNLPPWQNAQSEADVQLARRGFVNREVVRLDNRIDQIILGTGQVVQLATYSESDVWDKPPGAFRVVVDVIAGSSGGGEANYPSSNDHRPGVGGYSGGRSHAEFDAEDLPSQVVVTVGRGGAGATSYGSNGAAGTDSSFGSFLSATGATATSWGSGNQSFRQRGGTGGSNQLNLTATKGSDGTFHAGGIGGGSGANGENGGSLDVGQVGVGSSGGGGGPAHAANGWPGGRGGHGGWPGGAGGGGGASTNWIGTPSGDGGNGGSGAVYVTSYLKDDAGVSPSAPTGVTVTNIAGTSATVSWTAATDDIAVAKYNVLLGGLLAGSSETLSFDLLSLNPGNQYTVTVTAEDLGKNVSDPSAPVTFTTSI